MFAPIKYLLVDSAALLLINLAAAPLPRPRPVAVLEVWLTQGTELSIISCLQSRGRNFHVFMSWHWWQQACKHSPAAQSSTTVLTPFTIPRTKWSNARPPELRHREMLTTTDADRRDSEIVFPISVDMTNVQTPALFWRWTTAIFVANNISHTLSRHEADAEDQTFLCPNIFLNDTVTWHTLVSNTWYLWTIRSSESLRWVSRRMTKQTQARSWSWLLVSVYGCCRLCRLVTPAITPSQCGQRAQLMLLMTNGEGILLLMTTSIIYIQMLLGATQSHKSECYTFHPGIIDCVFVLTGNTSLNTSINNIPYYPILWLFQ